MRDNADQNNAEYGHLLRNVMETIDIQMTAKFLIVKGGFWNDNEKNNNNNSSNNNSNKKKILKW